MGGTWRSQLYWYQTAPFIAMLLTGRIWQSGIKVLNSLKRFLFSTGYTHSFTPPFLQSPTVSSSRGHFHQQLLGETIDQHKLHGSAFSSLFQDLSNWEIILTYYPKIWNKRWEITASLKWDSSWEKWTSSESIFFFSIEKKCFRGNWHFPEESLGNWIWNLCIWTEHLAFWAVIQKN